MIEFAQPAARRRTGLGSDKPSKRMWNVKGPHFIGLHELFDKSPSSWKSSPMTSRSERLKLGGIALGTIQIVSKKSRLPALSA
jgi:DNA-binding ferritin-like protein